MRIQVNKIIKIVSHIVSIIDKKTEVAPVDPFNGKRHGLMPPKGETEVGRKFRVSAEYERQEGYQDGVRGYQKAKDTAPYLSGYAKGFDDSDDWRLGYMSFVPGVAHDGGKPHAYYAGWDMARLDYLANTK